MSVFLSPVGGAGAQFFDNNGDPLTGGKLYTYAAGTTTPQATYTTSAGSTAWSNPIVLDAAGRVPSSGEIWLTEGASYKFVLKDADDVLIATYDNLSGVGDFSTVLADLANTSNVAKGDALVGFKQSNSQGVLSGAVGRTVHQKLQEIVSVLDFGADPTGVSDCAGAFDSAMAALSTNGGVVYLPAGTYAVERQIVVPTKVTLVGDGIASENGTGPSYRGATCILRNFAGSDATVALNNDASGIDMIDVDGNLQGTGDQVQVWGSRVRIGAISTRNSGGDGVRIGKTDLGASTINANFWGINYLVTCGNAKNGIRIDDTNTTVTTTYPLGIANANAGYAVLIDARSNGEDGLQIGNANDNVFVNVGSQFNAGIGIHFKTDGTNSGPRCNTILGNDSEANVGNDIQIDAATLPVSGPGLYNKIYGNRSVAVFSRIVDNSTGSMVFQWNASMLSTGYQLGKAVSAYNLAGDASFDGYAGANAAATRLITKEVGTTGARQEIWTKKDAGALVLRGYWGDDGTLVFNPTGASTGGLGILIGKTTGNTTTPGIQLGDVGVGNYYTRINMVGDGSSSDTRIAFYNANGQVGSIVTSGTATAYNISSDYRLKDSVKPADGAAALAAVMSWPIRSFTWKASGQQDIGVIAHELQAVKPAAVSGEKDAVRNGEIDPQGVDYSKLVPELVAAVQHLAKIVEELRSK